MAIISEAFRMLILKESVGALDREYAVFRDAIPRRHSTAGFIAKHSYDIAQDSVRTCISCGSKTQPCCGH